MALYADIEPVFKQLTATVVTDDSVGLGIQMGLNRAMEILAKAPIVEVEPVVHAHWICDCEPYHICSNCRHKFILFDRVPRCPNCGAHMDGHLEIRTAYCPICDKHFEVRLNDSMGSCPDCGHHVVLHRVEVEDA